MEHELNAVYEQSLHPDKTTLTRLSNAIARATATDEETAALALCHAQMARLLIKERRYEEAHQHAHDAKRIEPDHVATLTSLVELHLPSADDDNPHADDETALEFIRELEDRCGDDAAALGVCGTGYEQLGLYDDVLRVLNRASEHVAGAEARDALQKRTASAYMERYRNCPDEMNSAIMRYLIDLVEYAHNGLTAEEVATAKDEITERAEYVLQEYLESQSWMPACKLVWKMGRAVPLSDKMAQRMTSVFERSGNLSQGVEFFTECMQTHVQPALALIFASRARLHEQLGKHADAQQDRRMAELQPDQLARVQAQIRVVQGAFGKHDGQERAPATPVKTTPSKSRSPAGAARLVPMTPGELSEGMASEGEGLAPPAQRAHRRSHAPEERKEEMGAEEEVGRLAHELAELRHKFEETKTELKTTQVMYGQSKREIARMQQSLSSSRRAGSRSPARAMEGIDLLQKENEDLKAQLESWIGKWALLDQRNKSLEEEIADKTETLRELRLDNASKSDLLARSQGRSGSTSASMSASMTPKKSGRIFQKRLSVGGAGLPDAQILRIKPPAQRPSSMINKCVHVGRRLAELSLLMIALAVLAMLIKNSM